VLHNHFLVNDKKVNIPSFILSVGDVVQVKEKSKTLEVVHGSLRTLREVPEWLEIDKVKLHGTVLKEPDRLSIPGDIQERLVVELYSK
jgi:small subunit ribosomal protein S4